MKARKLLALITALFLITSMSLTAMAADWNLAQQGDLKITKDGAYTITSTDGKGKLTSTNNTITIADDVKVTITLDNVAMELDDVHGIQMGSGATVTLNLVGDNSILNISDGDKPVIENKDSDLTITSKSGGTLKLREEAEETEEMEVEIDQILSLDDIDAKKYVVIDDVTQAIKESDYIQSDIELGQSSIMDFELVIEDEPTPLADGKAAKATFTIEGNAQIHAGSDVYASSGSYVVGFDTLINGIPGWDIESLFEELPIADDYSNLILVADGKQLTNCCVLYNKAGDVSAIVPESEDMPNDLKETKLSDKALVEGANKKDILYSGTLSFDEKYEDTFVLRFQLDKAYAGQIVEIRTLDKGKVVTETATVSAAGMVAVAADTLGSFAVIAK